MGFEIPGIGYKYRVKYVNSNWRKKRKIKCDRYGRSIVSPSVTSQAYSYSPLIPQTETYDFNMLYTDDWNIRTGMNQGRDYDLHARRNSVLDGFDTDVGNPEYNNNIFSEDNNNDYLVSKPLQINTNSDIIKSENCEHIQPQKSSELVDAQICQKSQTDQEKSKPKQLVDLPTEILIRIIALSKNIAGILQMNHFFFDFVVLHEAHIYRLLTECYYLNRIKCSVTFGSVIKSNRLTDEEHQANSFALTIEDMQKEMQEHEEQRRKRRRSSIHYQSKDTIVVLDSECLVKPYMTYRLFKTFTVDAILPASKVEQLKSEVKHSVDILQKNLTNSYQTTFVGTDRLNKAEVLKKFVSESQIPFPYIDPNDPSNLDYLGEDNYIDKLRLVKKILLLHPIFENMTQDIVFFLIELNIKVKQVMNTDTEFNSIRLRLKDIKTFINDQTRLDEHSDESNDESAEENMKTRKEFVITNSNLVLSILMKAGKKWSKYLLQYVSQNAVEEDEHFWTCIMESKRLDYVRWLEKYGKLSPGAGVLNILARSSQSP